MKKSLIAVAVSSAALVATSAQAEKLDVYGNIQLAYTVSEATPDDKTNLGDNGSTFGFKGEKELKHGLTGFFKYELEADTDEKTSDVEVNLDQAYVGAKGGFGKVQLGSFDSIYNNAIQDSIDQFEALGITGIELTEEGDTLAYFSPSFGGLELQLSLQTKGNDEDETKVGATDRVKSDTAVTSVIKYSAGDFSVALGYDDKANEIDSTEVFGLNVAYSLPVVNLSAKYETSNEDVYLGISARSNFSAGSLYASFETVDQDDETKKDYDEYGVGALYNLDTEGNVFVYAEVGQSGEDENTTTALGATYVF
ncbi:porin [Marinomonas agarivorans]|nr:porin [Marinomonas agarivorans]